MTSRSFLSFFLSCFPSHSPGVQTKGSASCGSWLCHPGAGSPDERVGPVPPGDPALLGDSSALAPFRKSGTRVPRRGRPRRPAFHLGLGTEVGWPVGNRSLFVPQDWGAQADGR